MVCRLPASRGLRSVSRPRLSPTCLLVAACPLRVLSVCASAVSVGLTRRELVLTAHPALHTSSLTQEASGRRGGNHMGEWLQISW